MIIIVTGVSGSGKTTLGSLLAKHLHLPFYDADDFHSTANVEKMSTGIPLTDHDRWPWLDHLAENILKWHRSGGAILACSALREAYRERLQTAPDILWLHLKGIKEVIAERMEARKGHYMNPDLLDSQITTWEEPAYGYHLDITKSPDQLVLEILALPEVINVPSRIGIIGMGVMGKSLALNFAEKGVPVSVYNRFVEGKEEQIASRFADENRTEFPLLKGFDELQAFLFSLHFPKTILLMIPAGGAIDHQIAQLESSLHQGDILIDGGNSFYEDSNRRVKDLEEKGLRFLAMGVSGGEEGARRGPSLMPGGNREAYETLAPYFQKIAAKDAQGNACVDYIGPAGSGHFIKMVHNSIEYAEMQALAEIYQLMKYGLKLTYPEISKVLKNWANEGLRSYLLEITADILMVRDGREYLLDMVLDKAGQKGTGSWSLTTALKYQVAYSPLSEAVTARMLSSDKEKRTEFAEYFGHRFGAFAEDKVILIEKFKNAYALTRFINHEVGFDLMKTVSQREGWNLNLSEIARIWTNGCIIRSTMMEQLVGIFKDNTSILTTKSLKSKIKEMKLDLTYIVGLGLQHSHALPVMSAAANYFLSRITNDSPANLIQAQRDYFGAHTYQRKDDPSETFFHSDWKASVPRPS